MTDPLDQLSDDLMMLLFVGAIDVSESGTDARFDITAKGRALCRRPAVKPPLVDRVMTAGGNSCP